MSICQGNLFMLLGYCYNDKHMEKLKFGLFSVIVLTLVVFLGYWSFSTLQSGTEYVADKKIKELKKENEDLKTELKNLADERNLAFQPKPEEPTINLKEDSKPIVYKYQGLINELQKLVNDNIFLKQKSRGSKVGAVQKFFNIYNSTSNRVDNDYGADTVKAVAVFQKDSELNANGEAGPDTFNKMIDWLKEQE